MTMLWWWWWWWWWWRGCSKSACQHCLRRVGGRRAAGSACGTCGPQGGTVPRGALGRECRGACMA
ncbi:hypothetical protein E2C01_065303 [Portunus trituberculatus]|uniref:Secreted protein n=1 Tax=Portunus trituberculatus TaxID=210409 RepID=A0A5B7HP78_PORTR|nr:hypothetical protein [Portunus trituberculatus]